MLSVMRTRMLMQYHYYKIWDEFISERNQLFSNSKFENNNEKFIWALFSRINSLSDEIIFLARNSRFTSSQILMRSALETYIDLKCLVDDDTFIDVLMQAERKSEITYLKNFDHSNRYYGSISKDSVENKLSELNSSNDKSKNFNIYDKFNKANELEAYKTVYNHLCRFSHGNLTALASKNFEDDKIKLNTSITDSELIFILSSSINLAIASSIEVSSKLGLREDHIKLFQNFLNEVNAVAKKFA
jgi:hypothetical protein